MRRPPSRVLYAHSVDWREGSTDPRRFRQQLEAIVETGLRPVALSDLVQQVAAGERRGYFALTLDDGYADNVDEALPILDDLQVPATLFVVSGLVDPARVPSSGGSMLYPGRWMVAEGDLVRWSASGREVGSHSHDHRLLRESAALDYDNCHRDLAVGRHLLEDVTGAAVRHFAYPNGQRGSFSRLTGKLLSEVGFDYGWTTIWGSARHFKRPYALPRCEIRHDRDAKDAAERATGAQDYRRVVQLARKGAKRWGGRR